MVLFDSHCHMQHAKFGDESDTVIERALAAGVSRILNLATGPADAHAVIAIAEEHGCCLAAVGCHPGNLDEWTGDAEAVLREAADHPQVVVYGEIGLDYYWKTFDHGFQRTVFRRQLAVARELGLPVSMHCREAYADLIADLRAEKGYEIGGVAHCFFGTGDEARELVDMGFYLGVGGSHTYKGNAAAREILEEVGPDRLVIETDAPFLPPLSKRGKRNEPAYVAETCAVIGALFDMDAGAFAERTWKNAHAAFRLE